MNFADFEPINTKEKVDNIIKRLSSEKAHYSLNLEKNLILHIKKLKIQIYVKDILSKTLPPIKTEVTIASNNVAKPTAPSTKKQTNSAKSKLRARGKAYANLLPGEELTPLQRSIIFGSSIPRIEIPKTEKEKTSTSKLQNTKSHHKATNITNTRLQMARQKIKEELESKKNTKPSRIKIIYIPTGGMNKRY